MNETKLADLMNECQAVPLTDLDGALVEALGLAQDSDGWWHFPWGGKESTRKASPDFSADIRLAFNLAAWLYAQEPEPGGRLFSVTLHPRDGNDPPRAWWRAMFYPGDQAGESAAEAIARAALHRLRINARLA